MAERILHILFDGPDDLAARIIRQQSGPGTGLDVRVVDMSADEVKAGELLEEIFAADKVLSWNA